MPHISRSEARRLEPAPKAFAPAAARPTQQALHLRCPVCSLLARLDLVQGGPYPSYSRLQWFGGGGVLVWDPPLDLTPAQLELLQEKLAASSELFQLPQQEWPARPTPKPPKAPPEPTPPPPTKPPKPKAPPKAKKPPVPEEVKVARGYVKYWEEKIHEADTPAALKAAQEHLAKEKATLALLEGGAVPPAEELPPEPAKKVVKKKMKKVSPPETKKAKPVTKKPVAETKAVVTGTPIPPFNFVERATRATAEKLIKHLRLLQGQDDLETPEASKVLEQLGEGVQAWVDDVEEMQGTEEGKENPNETRLEDLDMRHEALEAVVAALEDQDLDEAVAQLQEAFPPPAKTPKKKPETMDLEEAIRVSTPPEKPKERKRKRT